MSAAGQIKSGELRIENNPFAASTSGLRVGRPMQAALGELIRLVGLETSFVVISGGIGTGKTLLVETAVRALSGMGLSVKRFERGHLIPTRLSERCDVLLIDDADSISEPVLTTLLESEEKTIATTTVFLCLPTSLVRLISSGMQASVIQLQALSHLEARNYVLERGASMGRPDLFATDALELVINGSQGMPQVLRSTAERAFAEAARDGAMQVALSHVAYALASEGKRDIPKRSEISKPAIVTVPAVDAIGVPKDAPAIVSEIQPAMRPLAAERPKTPEPSPLPSTIQTTMGDVSGIGRRFRRGTIQFAHVAATFVVVFVLVTGLINFLMANTNPGNRPVAAGTSRILTLRPPAAPISAVPSTPSSNRALDALVGDPQSNTVVVPRAKPAPDMPVERSAPQASTRRATTRNVASTRVPSREDPERATARELNRTSSFFNVATLPQSVPANPQPVEQLGAAEAVIQPAPETQETPIEATVPTGPTNNFYALAPLRELDRPKPIAPAAQGTIHLSIEPSKSNAEEEERIRLMRNRARGQAFFGSLFGVSGAARVEQHGR